MVNLYPLCSKCGTRHVNSCEDAADERRLWDEMARHVDDVTAMAAVPASLRGPNWRS